VDGEFLASEKAYNQGKRQISGSTKMETSVFHTSYSSTFNQEVSRINTESVLGAYQSLDDLARVLGALLNFWQPIKAVQHKAIFHEELPIFLYSGKA